MKQALQIQYVAITKLKPATYNPRKISNEALRQLKESIEKFHIVDPIIANSNPKRNQIVIGGHMRIKAARELGLTEVPVIYLNIEDIKKEKELNLRLNRNTGEWDFDKLKSFDIPLLKDLGFDDIDISHIWNENVDITEKEFDEQKELKKIKKPITKQGDIILLGKHKIICGDSTDPHILKKLFGKERASLVYSDPIYNIGLDYNGGIGGKQNYGGTVNDKRTEEEYENLLEKSIQNALSVSKEDIHIFYWCDQIYIGLIQQLYKKFGIQNKRVCIWIKNNQNPTPQIAFNKCYEPCVYGIKGKPYITTTIQNLNEVLNKELTTGNNLLEGTLESIDVWAVKRLSGKEYEHATSKPPKLHEKAIKRCSRPGDIILDSFLGSASTLIAAEQLHRRVYGVELEPRFCDLAIKRYEAYTGKKVTIIHHNEKNSS